MIRFFSQDTAFVLKGKREKASWLKKVAESRGFKIGDLNYIFCSDEYLLSVNKEFLGHDYYTDIITFDNSDDYYFETGKEAVSGDIYISVDTVRVNGETYGEGFDRELDRVIVHGLLHLTGCDDTTSALEKEMHSAEDEALKMIGENLAKRV